MEQVTKIIFIRFFDLLFDNTSIYNNVFLNDYHRTIDFHVSRFEIRKELDERF